MSLVAIVALSVQAIRNAFFIDAIVHLITQIGMYGIISLVMLLGNAVLLMVLIWLLFVFLDRYEALRLRKEKKAQIRRKQYLQLQQERLRNSLELAPPEEKEESLVELKPKSQLT